MEIGFVGVHEPRGTGTPAGEDRVIALIGAYFDDPHALTDQVADHRECLGLVRASEVSVPPDEMLRRAFPAHGSFDRCGRSERIPHQLDGGITANDTWRREPPLNPVRSGDRAEHAGALGGDEPCLIGG